jgi:hypothetical protein
MSGVYPTCYGSAALPGAVVFAAIGVAVLGVDFGGADGWEGTAGQYH